MDSHSRGNGKHIVEQFVNIENASINEEEEEEVKNIHVKVKLSGHMSKIDFKTLGLKID